MPACKWLSPIPSTSGLYGQTMWPGADPSLPSFWFSVLWFDPYSEGVSPHGSKMAAAAPLSWLCLFSYLQQKPWSHCVYRVLGCAYSWPTTEAREMQCVVRFRQGRKGEVPPTTETGVLFL